MPHKHRILALIFSEFEALDFFGPLGAIIPGSDYYTLKVVNIHNLPAPHGLECSIKNGVGIVPNLSLTQAFTENFDTLFIPGGFGMFPLVHDPMLLEEIGILVDRAKTVFTVCTGSVLLAATGRLAGWKATTNKRYYDEFVPKYPGVAWQRRARWVQDGKYLTASGVTAGMDAGFAFIANTYVAPEDRKVDPTEYREGIRRSASKIQGFDPEKALRHARHIAFRLEYRWHEDPEDDPFVDDLFPDTKGCSNTI